MPNTDLLNTAIPIISTHSSRAKAAYAFRRFREGNNCGHEPDAPRWQYYQKPSHQLHPLQKKAQRKVKGFYRNQDVLPRLGRFLCTGELRRINRRSGLFRKISSERREHIVIVLLWVIGKINFATGEVGVRRYDTGKTWNTAIETIAEELHLNYRAVQRALCHLNVAGYMGYEERYDYYEVEKNGKTEKKKRRVISIRSLTPAFFYDIGVTMEELANVQTHAKNKWNKDRLAFIEKRSKKGRIKLPPTYDSIENLDARVSNTELGRNTLRQLRLMLESKPLPS